MLNKVQIIGRLGADPELKYSQTGSPVCTLSVATDESYQDREGNKVQRTEWHRVSVFQRAAENCATYLAKGSLVYVEGSLQTRKWQDQNGQDRFSTGINAQRVQFLDRKGEGGGAGGGAYQGAAQGGNQGGYQGGNQGGSYGNQGQRRSYANQGNQGNQGNQAPQNMGPNEDMGSPFPSEMDDVPF